MAAKRDRKVRGAGAAERKAAGKVAGPTGGVSSILVEALEAVAAHYRIRIVVTSGKRSGADQARAMWKNWKTNLKQGALYLALRKDPKLLTALREAHDGGDRKTFDTLIKKIARRLSRHVAGQAVDLKKKTDRRAVKALATMFHHIEEKTCHHFDTKQKPAAIDDATRARWPE